MKSVEFVALALMLSACETVNYIGYQAEEDLSYQRANQEAYLYSNLASPFEGNGMPAELEVFGEELQSALVQCGFIKPPMEQFLPGSSGALMKLGVGFVIGGVDSAIEAELTRFKKMGSYEYNPRLVIDRSRSTNGSENLDELCLMVIRGSPAHEEEMAIGVKRTVAADVDLVLVLRAVMFGKGNGMADSFVLVPVFLAMEKSGAITQAGEPPVVSLSVAVSISEARRGNDGVHAVESMALQTITFRKVPLGGTTNAAADCSLDPNEALTSCPFVSGLMATPTSSSSTLEISLGLVETGTGIPDADAATEELKAITEAVGPLIDTRIDQLYPGE